MDISVIFNIKSCYPNFSLKERKIADYILKNPTISVDLSIDQLSDKIGISESTLVRFVRKLNFSGYKQFRICLARETVPVDIKPIEQGLDSVEAALKSTQQCLEETFRQLDHLCIKKSGKMIANARQFFIAGLGGSGIVASDLYHRFVGTDVCCQFSNEFHTQLMLASQATKEDVALIISHTGIDLDAIAIAKEYQTQECPIIVITSHPLSPIAQLATEKILVRNTQPSPIVELFSERIASLVIIDSLYIEVITHKSKDQQESINRAKNIMASRRM